jgi:hypothetical protein
MPYSMVSSDSVALRLVAAGQDGFGVWGRLARFGGIWGRLYLGWYWFPAPLTYRRFAARRRLITILVSYNR